MLHKPNRHKFIQSGTSSPTLVQENSRELCFGQISISMLASSLWTCYYCIPMTIVMLDCSRTQGTDNADNTKYWQPYPATATSSQSTVPVTADLNVHLASCSAVLYLLVVSLVSMKHWLTELEVMASLFAAAIHDYEHTGTTNNFHIHTK